MTPCARIDKISFVHSFYDIAQNLVGSNVSISLIYYAELFDVKMCEGIVTYLSVSGNLQKCFKMTPGVITCNMIGKCKPV